MKKDRNLNWDAIESTILSVAKISEEAIERLVLVGGSACAFYQKLLENANDLDFKAPGFSPEEKMLWLSKDIDFMGMTKEELSELLCIPLSGEPPNIYVNGVWVDILDNGLTISEDTAVNAGVEFDLDGVGINVLSPTLLYKEKIALTKLKVPRPHDKLHVRTLQAFIPYFMVTTLEKHLVSSKKWVKMVSEIKSVDPFLLEHPSLLKRLQIVVEKSEREYRSSVEWIKNHILKANFKSASKRFL